MAFNETSASARVLADARGPGSARPTKGIMGALPIEILKIIFDYVYLLAYECENEEVGGDPTRLEWSPYDVLIVCKRWRDFAQSLHFYKEHIMIYVDEPLSIPLLEGEMRMARPKMLKVLVVRKEYPSTPAALNEADHSEHIDVKGTLSSNCSEKALIDALMPIIAKNIVHFRVLVFDLEFRSSLPCISHFSNSAAKLRTLSIKSRTNDSTNTDPLLGPKTKSFSTTHLRFLDLDGAIFARAVHIPGWRASLKTLAQKDISISNIFAGEYGDFDLYDLIQNLSNENIGHIANLKLSAIYLSARRCHDLGKVTINISQLEFYGLGYSIITGFFAAIEDAIRPNYIILCDCDLTPPVSVQTPTVYFCLSSFRLTLRDIDAETSADDITSFVRNWDGFSLCFERCQNVDDSVLKIMTTVDPTHSEPDAFYIPSCREVAMSPFTNITVQPVKDLIVARAQLAERHSPVGERPSDLFLSIHALWFTGHGPQLSENDQEWFKGQKLNGFAWYPPRPQQDTQAEQAGLIDVGIPLDLLTALPGTAAPATQTQVDKKHNLFLVTPTPAPAISITPTMTTVAAPRETPRASTHREGWVSPLIEDDYANMSAEDFEQIARLLD